MGSGEAPDRARVIEVTVLPNGAARPVRRRPAGTRTRRVAISALILALLIAAVTAGLVSDRNGRRQPVNGLARAPGPSGVAAAYGYPLRCVSVTIVLNDRRYARADFNHLSPCGRYTGDPTAIFRYVAGRWQAVLDAVEYRCPVASLPATVQSELGVCLRDPVQDRSAVNLIRHRTRRDLALPDEVAGW